MFKMDNDYRNTTPSKINRTVTGIAIKSSNRQDNSNMPKLRKKTIRKLHRDRHTCRQTLIMEKASL